MNFEAERSVTMTRAGVRYSLLIKGARTRPMAGDTNPQKNWTTALLYVRNVDPRSYRYLAANIVSGADGAVRRRIYRRRRDGRWRRSAHFPSFARRSPNRRSISLRRPEEERGCRDPESAVGAVGYWRPDQ